MYTRLLLLVAFAGTLTLATPTRDVTAERHQQPITMEPSASHEDEGWIQLDVTMKNVSRYEGEPVRLTCEITGSPVPQYRWFKAAQPLALGQGQGDATVDKRMEVRQTYWGSRLRISSLTVKDSGVYTCEAFNKYGARSTQGYLNVIAGANPNKDAAARYRDDDRNDDILQTDLLNFDIDLTNAAKQHKLELPHQRRHDTVNGEGESGRHFCQQYRGIACAKMLANKNILVSSRLQQSTIEQKLTVMLTALGSLKSSVAECGELLIQMLCYSAFPLCSDGEDNRARRLCRDECHVIQDDVCRTDFMAARSHLDTSDLVLPTCSDLPTSRSRDSDSCIRIRSRDSLPGHSCYNGTGVSYRGTVSRTLSGFECQRWTDNNPHAHYLRPADYPDIGEHNYCRNPGNTEVGPWCYTMNEHVRIELCDVPLCPLVVAQGHGQQMSEFLTIIVPSIVAPLTLALLVGIICICRMAKTKVNRPCKTPPVELNVLLRQPTITVTSSARLRDFPKSSVRLLQELTDGHYGKLYRAELLGYHGNGTVTRVIVKVLHDNAPPDLRQQFDSDLDHAADIRHPNVVCLLGVCRGSDVTRAPLALYEYVPHGDLRQFLLLHSPHCDLGPVMGGGQEEAGGMLSQADMLHISVQLASALDYLTAHGHVHTDVAARNVLVGDGLVVKVSELGLGRCQYPADYYCPRPGQAALPVRWMAPETLFHGHLTAESNVWSLGVLLWEVFTYGLQPYYGYANHEVIDMIGSHQILPCPDHASAAVYALMVDTWHELPTQRPTLPHLHAALQQLRTCSLLLVQPMSDSGHASHPSHPSLVSNMNEAAAAHFNRLSAPPSRDNFTPISQPVLVQDSHVSSSATSSASMTSQSDRSAAMWKVNGGQKHRHNQLITSPIDRRMTDV